VLLCCSTVPTPIDACPTFGLAYVYNCELRQWVECLATPRLPDDLKQRVNALIWTALADTGFYPVVFGLAALLYVVTGLDVLQVVLEEVLAELEYLHDSLVGHGVESVPALATHLYVTAPGQAAQMVRDPRLRRPELVYQLPDLHLAPLRQKQQDREPGRVGETIEQPGEEAHLLALAPYFDTG
jgi:hypothetical protein